MVPPASDRISRVPPYSGSRSPRSDSGYGALTLCGRPSHAVLLSLLVLFCGPSTPALCRFGLLPFRSPLLGKSLLFSFPPGTQMFHFPGFLSHGLCVPPWMTQLFLCRVSPFGYLRIFAPLQLPAAFRRSVRPSSAPGGKASSVCPSSLNHFRVFAFTLKYELEFLFNFSLIFNFSERHSFLLCLSVIQFSKTSYGFSFNASSKTKQETLLSP